MSKRKTTEKFIESAKKIHGEKYDYLNTVYKTARDKVEIICPKHGSWWVLPNNHAHPHLKSGCPKCADNIWARKRAKTTEQFITEAQNIHISLYDYSKTNYINCKTKVEIICPKHGSFWKMPNDHTKLKQGCPACQSSTGELRIHNYLRQQDILFIRQAKFQGLPRLRFDFYLPEQQLCIEYDGIQHFKPQKHFGGQKHFKDRQKRDQLKNIFCQQRNMKLLRIPYYKKENIEKILEREI
jgi:very-short-patch-repair endonuclease